MIIERIKKNFQDLTKSQKIAGHYLQHNIHTAAFLSAKEIGQRCGCSEPTLHRLAKALGYENYQAMSLEMKEYAMEKRVLQRFNNYLADEKERSATWSAKHFSHEIDNIYETMKITKTDSLNKAVSLILKARRIYIAGWRGGLAVTGQLAYLLNYLLGNATLIPLGEAAEYSCYLHREDVLIAVGFPRYCKTTLKLCEVAYKKGTNTIIFTDSELSPFCALSKVKFFAATRSDGILDSYVAPLVLTNLIINEIAYQKPELIKENLENMETTFDTFGLKFDWNEVDK